MRDRSYRSPGAPATDHSFDAIVLPHLAAGRRLARWLMRNEHDAEDVLQDASLRAFRYCRTFAGGNGRAWFLRIVRNTCLAGAAAAFAGEAIRSTKSNTASRPSQPIPKCCSFGPMMLP